MEFRVTFYRTEDGDKPVARFLDDLEIADPVLSSLTTMGLAKLGDRRFHGPPLTAAITGTPGLYELRVGRGDIARVFFFFRPNREIVCTNGYIKKSLRLDPREVARAERHRADWERRFPGG